MTQQSQSQEKLKHVYVLVPSALGAMGFGADMTKSKNHTMNNQSQKAETAPRTPHHKDMNLLRG